MLQQLCPFVSSTPEIDQLFLELEQVFPYPKKAGVAVSGGSDSMFLSYLLVSFFAKKGRNSDFLYFLPVFSLNIFSKVRSSKNSSTDGTLKSSKDKKKLIQPRKIWGTEDMLFFKKRWKKTS